MNRQARLFGTSDWTSYGSVTHSEAAAEHAKGILGMSSLRVLDEVKVLIETRDEFQPVPLGPIEVTAKVVVSCCIPRMDEFDP